jgi:hypothetical protein
VVDFAVVVLRECEDTGLRDEQAESDRRGFNRGHLELARADPKRCLARQAKRARHHGRTADR